MKAATGALLVALAVLAPSGAASPRAFVGVSVAAGDYHSCALVSGGTVKCWGDNTDGEIGDGTTIQRSTPVPVSGLGGKATAISLGGVHSCALLEGGGVRCWGWNEAGQLGIGPGADRSTPVQVRELESGVASIAAGGEHTCVLTASGGVKCWGHNNFGGVGDGTTIPRTAPVDVVGLSSGVKAVAAGRHFTCAVTLAGAVKCWGLNESGQVGDGTNENRRSPVDVVGLGTGVTAVGAYGNHACALLNDGRVKCWGANQLGELGDGTLADSHVPVQVSGLSDAVAIASGGRHNGGSHTCAVTGSGAVECWGSNRFGQLGDGTTTARSKPVRAAGLDTGAVSVAAGGQHTCAVMSSGQVKCWGWNPAGQVGDGTTVHRSTPVDVVEREVRDCVVPRVVGLRLVQARAKLTAANCTAGRVTKRYSRRPKGRVIAQSRSAGTRLAEGSSVALVVSKGRKPHR